MAFCCKEYNIKVHITTQHGGEGEKAAEEAVGGEEKVKSISNTQCPLPNHVQPGATRALKEPVILNLRRRAVKSYLTEIQ